MTKLLLAKPLIDSKLANLAAKCSELKTRGLTPKMKVILVGDSPASLVYIKHKRKLCEQVGADFILTQLPSDLSEKDFLHEINLMNNDSTVTGCFVQLPIPKQLQNVDVTSLIAPEKDVDGFHVQSFTNIYKNDFVTFYPCTPKGIITLAEYYNIELEGKDVVVLGRSLIVGKPLSLMLNNLNATVTMCHSKTRNLAEHTRRADIIISAIGIPKFLKKEHFNSDKNQIVIDVGMNKDSEGKLCGDVDFENVVGLVAAITPVPGGVGPMTVYSLIENLITATEQILTHRK